MEAGEEGRPEAAAGQGLSLGSAAQGLGVQPVSAHIVEGSCDDD